MRSLTILTTIQLVLLSAIPCRGDSHAEAAWGTHSIWDDGLAEVAVYDAGTIVYGKGRSYESTYITVKEDLNASTYTKADPPYEGKDLLPVLKLNIVSQVGTENYPYRYLTSVFVDRGNVWELHKLTTSSQEWCGNTFKMVKTGMGSPEVIYHSYWEDQSDGSYPLEASENRILEDQLPLSLRGLPFANGYRRDIRLVRSLIGNRAPAPEVVSARLEILPLDTVTVTAGEYTVWPVRVTGQAVSQTYWFADAYPNILVKSETGDGRSVALKHMERRAYW